MAGRPRGRQKNITGGGKDINRRGSGLGTGPVGMPGGYGDRPGRGSGFGGPMRSTGGGGLISKLIIVIVFIIAAKTGFGGFFTGGSGALLEDYMGNPSGSYGSTLTSVFENLGGGSVSAGWDNGSNVGSLDTSVNGDAREKYTEIVGNGQDEVTLMIYLCGTDLESRSKMATSDLQEMIGADIADNVNVLVYTGGCKQWQNNAFSSEKNQIWQVTSKGVTCLEKNMGNVPMTDEDTLSSFIKWCAKKYPANRNMLIMWDHGSGSVKGFGYDEKFAS